MVLFNPGEIAAAPYVGYLTNRTLSGVYAQELGAAAILVEHRYWGYSSPFEVLSTDNMKYLTLRNAIADMNYFAKHVKLPFDTSGKSNADKAPWIFVGGSYTGALAAWISSIAPGTFWAYHASSAPAEAVYDYWQYFYPVQQGMPSNCSKDVTLVVEHVDDVLSTGSEAEKLNLKIMFGLQNLTHDGDVASALQNGPWAWQSNSFTTGYSNFYQFCDAVEGVTGGNSTIPTAQGVGLTKALAGYSSYIKNQVIPGYCQNYGYSDAADDDVECLDSYNPQNHMYTDLTVSNPYDRQWMWMLCNEPFSYWQDGAPEGTPTIVSRHVTAAYWQRQCDLFFPTVNGVTYGSNPSKTPHTSTVTENLWTGGWFIPNKATKNTRVLWVNGEFDPWRTAGVSSQFRPGGEWQSSAEAPVYIVPKGIHTSDLSIRNGAANAGVAAVQASLVKQMVQWVGEYKH